MDLTLPIEVSIIRLFCLFLRFVGCSVLVRVSHTGTVTYSFFRLIYLYIQKSETQREAQGERNLLLSHAQTATKARSGPRQSQEPGSSSALLRR